MHAAKSVARRLHAVLFALSLATLSACGGGGESGGAGGSSSGSGNQSTSPAPPAPAAPSAWTASAPFGATYGGPPASQSLASTNDGQGHFLYGEWVNTNTTSLKAHHRSPAAGWDAGLTLGPSVAVVSQTRSYDRPTVRVDDAGNALAVWTYRDSSALNDRSFISQVFFGRRDALTNTWSTPQVLQKDPAGYARDAHLTIEGSGLAWAVWTERTFKDAVFSTRDLYAVFAAKFDPASGWGTPEKITDDLNGVLHARVTTDRRGNPRAIVAFQSGVALEYTLYAARRSAAGSWGSLETIAFALPAGGLAPDLSENDLAVDVDDNAVAVWREYDGTRYLIRSRHYSAAGGWDPTVDLQPPGRENGFAPQLAMDEAGNGFVVWHAFDFDRAYGIWSARFEQALGWTALEIISSPADVLAEDSTFPRIGVDRAGNAVAIWSKYDFHLNQTIVRANYYSRTSGWGTDDTISRGEGVSWRPDLSVSSTGYATAIWWQQINNHFQGWSATRPPAP